MNKASGAAISVARIATVLAATLAIVLLLASCASPAYRGRTAPGPDDARAAALALSAGLDKPESESKPTAEPSQDVGTAWKIAGIGSLAAIVLGALAFAVRALRSRLATRGAPAAAVAPAPSEPRTASADQARSAAAKGEYGAGLVLLREACIELFAARGILRRRPSTTTGDVLRRITRDMASSFLPIARGAEARTFGGKQIDAAEWAEAERCWAELSGDPT